MATPGIGTDSKVILLVEDNVDDERLTLRTLRKHNIMNEVVVEANGLDALRFLEGKDRHALPAFVMLDMKLPGMSGLEVLRAIRANPKTSHIPVVVLTASEDEAQIEAAYAAGANSYVLKPSDPHEYGEMVMQIAMYWLLLNRSAPDRIQG
jgi:two-component system response regulator